MKDKYVVILGAGRGSRMESRDPNHSKVAYPILGKPLINYVIDAVKGMGIKEIYTVVGYGGEATKKCVEKYSKVVWQHQLVASYPELTLRDNISIISRVIWNARNLA